MTFGEVPSPPKAQCKTHEDVKVGDSVKVMVKGSDKPIECAVTGRRGRAVKLLQEDAVTTCWVDSTELISVVTDGAEELMSRAARAAAAAAEAAAKKKAEDEAKAAEKAREEARIAAEKAEAKRIYEAYMERAKKTIDWMPSGLYFNTDHLPIPDHQKDVFRVIRYEIDVTKKLQEGQAEVRAGQQAHGRPHLLHRRQRVRLQLRRRLRRQVHQGRWTGRVAAGG